MNLSLFGELFQRPLNGDEIPGLARRRRLSDFLPWEAHQASTRTYLLQDNAVGWLWECAPLAFAGEANAHLIEGLMRLGLPDGAVLQFTLFSDPDLTEVLDEYVARKRRDHPLAREAAQAVAQHFAAGAHGLAQMSGIPIRRFRCFIALRAPKPVAADDLAVIEELLTGAGLAPKALPPDRLVHTLRRLFHPEAQDTGEAGYDDTRPIRRQVIPAHHPLRRTGKELHLGGQVLRCITPKQLARQARLRDTNHLAGGPMGPVDDADQIGVPFLWTVNVVFDDGIKQALHVKGSVTMGQRAAGTAMQELGKRVEEFTWATAATERERFVRAIPMLWLIGADADQARRAASRARRLWEAQGYVMQEESALLLPMFIAALPHGLYTRNNNLSVLDRDFPVPSASLARILPIQGDFAGAGAPTVLLSGRKGQLVGLDLFDERANNHNMVVTAGSGAGKSVWMNSLVTAYWAEEALIRIIDLGYSYKKLTHMLGGRFIDIGDRQRPPVMNPWANLVDPAQELPTVAVIIAQMATANTGTDLTELQWTLLRDAVRFAYDRDGGVNGIDHVREFLHHWPRDAGGDATRYPQSARDVAQSLGYVLCDWCSEGRYGKFFVGQNQLDLAQDEFVVLELESLRRDPALFRVMTLQVLNAVTQDLYLSDRSRQRLVVFDEAWQFIKEGGQFEPILEEGYRRARKYGGSFTSVFQSPMDLDRYGQTGRVVWSNSAWKALLESTDYPQAASVDLLPKDDFLIKLLSSVKTVRPRYSEIFLDTPIGRGVGRLVLDPLSYQIATTAGKEVARIEALVAQGMDYASAIRQVIGHAEP